MTSVLQIIFLLLDVLWYFILAQVIMSWLLNFGILNASQPLVVQVWRSLNNVWNQYIDQYVKFYQTLVHSIWLLVAIVGILIIRIVLINNMSLFV